MKPLLTVLVILIGAAALSVASTVVIMRAAVTVTCSTAGSSTFAVDPETDGSWNVDINEDATGFYFDDTNDREVCETGGSGDFNSITYTAAASSSSDMWVLAQIPLLSNSTARTGFTLRRSTSNGARYVFAFVGNSSPRELTWYYWDGGGTNAESAIAVMTNCNDWATTNDYVGVRITGTGNNTVVDVWRNPSGTDPDDWGTPCHTDTTDPSTAVDSGTYAGIYMRATATTVRTSTFDNFSFGSCQ